MKSGYVWIFLVAVLNVVAGCGRTGDPEPAVDGRSHLRVKEDAARNRRWVLGLDEVRVHDAASNALVARVALPGWSVVRFACPPDMALDRSGAVYVTSNVQSKLWRIDAGDYSVKEHTIRLNDRERWDVGFGALAFGADGTLFAVTSATGTLWRIDIGSNSARIVALDVPLMNVCELTTQILKKLERSRQP